MIPVKGSLALIGESGAGKTTQIGELAQAYWESHRKRTVLFTCERGGYASIEPHIEAGLIKIVEWDQTMDFMVWLNHVCLGEEYANGAWTPISRDTYGVWAYDSGTAAAENIMDLLRTRQGEGKQLGGKSSFVVDVGDGSKIAANTETHYGFTQMYVINRIWASQRLPGISLWTFTLDRSEKADETRVAGPKIAGHAMTTELPRYFHWLFRVAEILEPDRAPRHVMYLQSHTSGSLGSYGNSRVPLAGFEELDTIIEPASLPQALERIEGIKQRVAEQLKHTLGL